jgi:CheY-like chemotaxis protein
LTHPQARLQSEASARFGQLWLGCASRAATPFRPARGRPAKAARVRHGKMTPCSADILLVDDDEAFCYVAAKVLREAGHRVLLAPDHRLALRILESPQPLDLLITDIVMPGHVNGFALARMARMRRLELRVLYVTAYELPVEKGIGKVLRKPIELEVLVAEVRNTLAGPPDPPS